MTTQKPVWDSDAEDDADNPEPARPEQPPTRNFRNFGARTEAKPNQGKEPANEREIQKDEPADSSSEWQANKKAPVEQAKGNQASNEGDEKIGVQAQKQEGPAKQDSISYDNFVSDLKKDDSKKQPENLNMSSWDTSQNGEETSAFKKKKPEEVVQATEQPQENAGFGGRGFGRGDGGFRRNFAEGNEAPNGGEGFGGRGGRFGGADREQGGGRGGFADRGGFGGDRGGGFGDRGGGFGDRGGGFGDRGFGGGRGGFGGDRGGGFGDRGGGRGGFGGDRGGGFGGRGGFGGDRGGGFGDRGGGRGGFAGRRDFGGDNQFSGGGFRRDFNSQTPAPSVTPTPPPEPIEAEPINVADLSVIESVQKNTVSLKISPEFRVNTTMATEPLGLKCWPSVSIYVKKSKVSLYLSRILDHNCSVLYFPYTNYTMDLHPGNLINQFPFDYRKKLKEKAKPAGEAYLQKCIGVKNFQIVGFAMIDKAQPETTSKSIASLFEQTERAQKKTIESVLVPYSVPMGSLSPIVKECIQALEKYDNLREIIISTNDPKTFCSAAGEFLQQIQVLADGNQLVIM